MKQQDRLLVVIVVGIIAVVVVTLAVALLRPQPEFRSDDSAEAVAHNYLLALQQGGYAQAYSYLSPQLAQYPADVDTFVTQLNGYDPYDVAGDETTLAVLSSRGTDTARIVVVEQSHFYSGGLFDSGRYETSFEMRVERVNGQWRILDSDRYFNSCWSHADRSCP